MVYIDIDYISLDIEYISAWEHWIFKILMSIRHHYGVIMENRQYNFWDTMKIDADIAKIKFE
jgi:hypothetical protein